MGKRVLNGSKYVIVKDNPSELLRTVRKVLRLERAGKIRFIQAYIIVETENHRYLKPLDPYFKDIYRPGMMILNVLLKE